MFPTIGFCDRKILGIVESQIETKSLFSLARILTSLRMMLFTIKIFGQINLCQQKMAQ
jgi:hypothetical protein